MATIELSSRYGEQVSIGHWNWGEFYRPHFWKIPSLVVVVVSFWFVSFSSLKAKLDLKV